MLTTLRSILSRLASSLRHRRLDQDFDEEVQIHLRMLEERFRSQGLDPEQARLASRRAFGGVDRFKERHRESRSFPWIDQTRQDVRYAFRTLWRNRAFTCTAVVILALGIGLNTAVFSVTDALLLRRLPVPDPEELVSFLKIDPASQTPPIYFSYREFEQLRDRSSLFSGMFASISSGAFMQIGDSYVQGAGERVVAARVSSTFFTVLGVRPILGRTFTEADDRTAPAEPLVVLSYAFWQRRFAGDPSVLGRRIIVARKIPFTIVGVAPPGFFGIDVDSQADMWWPLANRNLWPDLAAELNQTPVTIMGRLRSGARLSDAQAAASGIFAAMRQEDAMRGANAAQKQRLLSQKVRLESGATGQTEELRSHFGRPLLTLMLSVAAVLLIASINVGSLTIARACERRRELSLRLALGGGRFRLIRQLLTESLVLAAAAGIGSLSIAYFGIRVLLSYAPPGAAAALRAGLDIRSLAFTAGLVFISAMIFGLVPAIRATKVELQSPLQETRHSIRSRAAAISRFLIPAQIALSLVLLVGAGLFARTLLNLRNLDPGFEKTNVAVFQINNGAVPPARARQLVSQLEQIPSVESVTFFANLGQLSGNVHQSQCLIDGYAHRAEDAVSCVLMNVGPGFFETMGTSLLLGRGFRGEDVQNRPDIVVINETMAKQYFGEQNPLGRRIAGKEIIGVAKDAKYYTLREPAQRTMYTPILNGVLFPDVRFAVRSPRPAGDLAAGIRDVVQQVTPQFQLTRIETMNEVAEATLAQDRFLVQLASFFSLLGLVLVCVGLYGTLSYAVIRRTGEIGIRMALGARVSDVLGMFMRETFGMIAAGVALGFVCTLAATRVVSGLLFGLTATDPLTIAIAAALVAISASAAAYLPARRAARVEPLTALRHE